MVGLDLFAGAGGMSLGARLAGIDVRLAVEKDPHAASTYSRNHPDTNLICSDIRKLKEIPIKSNRRSGPTILFGGPPCQGFSTSNQRTRGDDNPDNWLFEEFLRIGRLWRPDWIVLENVRGLLETSGGLFLEKIVQKLRRMGYATHYQVLNAMDFGVPQNRSRIFIVGSLHGSKFLFPEPTGSRPITVGEALEDLPELGNGAAIDRLPYRSPAKSKYAKSLRQRSEFCQNNLVTKNSTDVVHRYRHIPPGGNWECIPRRLMKNYSFPEKCHTGIYHRLSPDKPSVVVGNYRKNMLIHPVEDRGLSVREAARLQSFPDNYVFWGSIGFQQQQVGNAVPPLLAKLVFLSIAKSHSPHFVKDRDHAKTE